MAKKKSTSNGRRTGASKNGASSKNELWTLRGAVSDWVQKKLPSESKEHVNSATREGITALQNIVRVNEHVTRAVQTMLDKQLSRLDTNGKRTRKQK